MNKTSQRELAASERDSLLKTIKSRFEKHLKRHKDIEWSRVQERLEANSEKLRALNEMEKTGGEPDVVGHDKSSDEFIFVDCSIESPKGRRSLCYDREGLDSRKEFKPADTAMDMAAAMGCDLLTEEQYRSLQELGEFDTKTSSWLLTPPAIRKKGGAIFGDRRYNHVFVYHNGASSYYAVRGFRCCLKV
ncbi:MAG: DUF4256 domain-containing protein [Candidatus Melainabacteria bacterium]|nr:MAG: DUF4256 domain-containing protein [Candidatus Melainabacteria bacterium]